MSRKIVRNKKNVADVKEKAKMGETFSARYLYFIMVALIFFIIGFFCNFAITGRVTQDLQTISMEEIGNKTVSYINNYLLPPGVTSSLLSITDMGSVYKIELDISSAQGSRNHTSYVTKDGKLLFVSGVDLTETPQTQQQEEQLPTEEITKTDKPDVHAFVMSYCPYGLQFIKAYIPVMELLGDKADIELNFVHYAMHGKKEIDENTRMYCIQKEQSDKLTQYLRCFVETDDYENCITETGIDKTNLESCISSTDEQFNITNLYNDKSTWSGGRFPLYPVNAELARKYGVSGSPTFIVNGKTIKVNRSPEAIKQAICSAFNNPPEECNQTLSTQVESPGIGKIGSGSGTISTGQC
jgi:hypothetical protein